MWIYRAVSKIVVQVKRTLQRYFRQPRCLPSVAARTVGKSGAVYTVVTESLDINVGYHTVVVGIPAVIGHQYASLLRHNRLTGENHVRRRLAPAGRGIDISGLASSRLLAYECKRRRMLADEFVGCRQIEYHFRSSHGKSTRRWNCDPQILTYLHADIHSVGLYDRLVFVVWRLCEPSALIEFVIIRNISLADDRRHAARHMGGAVEHRPF